MKTNFKKLPGSKIALEIELDQSEFLEYYKVSEEQARHHVHLKGFRPGMAPKELADQAIDREKVFHEAADNAVRRSLHGVIEEQQWIVIDKPQAELVENPKAKELGLRYKAELIIYPEVKLGDYQKIAKRILKEKKEITVDAAEAGKTLDWLRNSRAKEVQVARKAAKGDLVDADIATSVDGKPLAEAELKGDRFVVGESQFIPGFDEQFVGRSNGEALTFSLTAPADYWKQELRGKTLVFEVKLNAVYERTLPALDDAFAQALGPAFKTLADLEANVKSGLREEQERKERERIQIKMLEAIVAGSVIDVPDVMIEKTTEHLLVDLKAMLARVPQPGAGQGAKTDAELRAGLRERAKRNVLSQLAIKEITKREHLEPTREEVEAEAKAKNLDPEQYYDYSYGALEQRKVFAFLEGM